MKSKYPGISRIDSKHTHGWYVRVYAKGGVFVSKLFSDKAYGGKQQALKNAIKFRDHNRMVAELEKAKYKSTKRKPFYNKKPKNSTGVTGVNEIKGIVNGREVHYFQATWSEEGKLHTKKFYINSKRTREEAFESAVKYRKMMEEILYKKWLEKNKAKETV
ncbi:hypothetical protein [Caldithrix abyssi]|uniref:Pathogenesis-related transcriptional factor and ERF protein n=1 Tax=Caldithrix abyssi DSM 13497 TaxID=880073 RepID=H1XYA3_CALAY|nr:hypothetical protein [Caldithrix abyssi]APF19263.1 hypothetical protein Cabys_2514 [Caldithrix abyssi DSM 13497]EHO43170.1 pathogenesis-related transcriptional factor and ERF protein [Caldithrix abyssi DSM 13497]